MGERHIAEIESLGEDQKPRAIEATVELNYPEPTALSHILKDVARWSGQAFVMEPSLNAKVQIFAARRMTPAQAYELFLASLTVVNLRAVQSGSVVKIVASGLQVGA